MYPTKYVFWLVKVRKAKSTTILSTGFEVCEATLLNQERIPSDDSIQQDEQSASENSPQLPIITEIKPRPNSNKVIHTQSVPFTDIGSVAWASPAIDEFYRLGYINGVTQTEFMPNDNITREEFMKIFVNVFSLHDDKAHCEFFDVDESRWSYEFIAAAYQKGIINGISDTEFGVTENITRQDIATMIYIMFVNLGISVSHGRGAHNYDQVKSGLCPGT